MSNVYSNSYLTVFATFSRDSQEGFLKLKLEDMPVQYRLCDVPGDPTNSIYVRVRDRRSYSLLNSRGWVFQEYLLSPRILQFTPAQMAFECDTHSSLEGGQDSDHILDPRSTEKRLLHSSSYHQRDADPYQRWLNLVGKFSRRVLTYETDKLPAVAGLARTMQLQTNDEYFAGLWKRDLMAGLLWTTWVGKNSQPSSYIAPTWSWASTVGRIQYPDRPRRPFLGLKIDHIEVRLSGSNPFGQLSGGELVVSGPLRTIKTSGISRHRQKTYKLEWSGRGTVLFQFDGGEPPSRKDFSCLDCISGDKTAEREEVLQDKIPLFTPHGLLLEEIKAAESVYRRIGTFEVDIEGLHWFEEGFRETRVTIV